LSSEPKSFYKYCPIYDFSSLEKEYSLINLFESQVTFSTRNNFNDLFDSKVDFITPAKKEIRDLLPLLNRSEKKDLQNTFLGAKGEENIIDLICKINDIFDKYLFYCVTDDEKNNLMWSHYANSHKGFCIEWDSEQIKAQKVSYKNSIASFKIIDLIKLSYHLIGKGDPGKRIWDALRVKLCEWEYESEYRFQLSNNMQDLIKVNHGNFALISHEPEWIKSIIFGCRMDRACKKYIMENLPYIVQFKEVVEGKSSLLIKNIK